MKNVASNSNLASRWYWYLIFKSIKVRITLNAVKLNVIRQTTTTNLTYILETNCLKYHLDFSLTYYNTCIIVKWCTTLMCNRRTPPRSGAQKHLGKKLIIHSFFRLRSKNDVLKNPDSWNYSKRSKSEIEP